MNCNWQVPQRQGIVEARLLHEQVSALQIFYHRLQLGQYHWGDRAQGKSWKCWGVAHSANFNCQIGGIGQGDPFTDSMRYLVFLSRRWVEWLFNGQFRSFLLANVLSCTRVLWWQWNTRSTAQDAVYRDIRLPARTLLLWWISCDKNNGHTSLPTVSGGDSYGSLARTGGGATDQLIVPASS